MSFFHPTDDAGIVRLYLQRDERATRVTEKKYRGFILSICNGILQQKEDSEECLDAVLLKLWNTIPPQIPEDLKAYVARLARTTAIDLLKSGKRKKRDLGTVDPLDDYADFLVSDENGTDGVLPGELTDLINQFLQGLSERDRVCFVKRFYFCCPVDEIARQTHLSKSSVYFILDKAKKQLETILTEKGYLS